MHVWLEAIEKMDEEFGACAHYYVGQLQKIRLHSRKNNNSQAKIKLYKEYVKNYTI
jgi:hypothetical protein